MPSKSQLQANASEVSAYYGLDDSAFQWLIGAESSWNPDATNGNAKGIAQFMPGTAKQYGVTDPYDSSQSLWGAGAYLKDILNKNGGDYQAAFKTYGTTAAGASDRTVLEGEIVGNTANTNTGYKGLFGKLVSAYTSGSVSGFFGGSLTGESGDDQPLTDSEQKSQNKANGVSEDGTTSTGRSSSSWTIQGIFQSGAVVIIGIVFIAAGLFVLGKGKPR